MTEIQKKDWSRIKYPDSYISLGIWISILLFLTYSIEYLEIPLDRLVGMLQRMGYTLANRYYPPDLEYIADLDYMEYVLETIQMAYLGSLFGLIITLPLGWLGAFNLTPSRRFVYPVARNPKVTRRATGANLFQVMIFGVLPQVRVALTGIAIYTWDVAFRAATVVGFFGAGGMGWYLKRNVLQIETERVSAILVSIIILVLISEFFSAIARERVMKMK